MATTIASIISQARVHLRELAALADPSAPTVTPTGVTGATAYSYKVVAMHRHGQTAASSAGSTATGNAVLDSSNFNRITWAAVTGATAYRVYRTVGGATTGQIGIVGAVTQFDDTGLTADSTTAPTVNSASGRFWSDDELAVHATNAARDLWKAWIDIFQDHFITIDASNVSLAANSSTLTGVPTDCFRVLAIEPRDTTQSGSYRNLLFRPKRYTHPDFVNARSQSAIDGSMGGVIYYEPIMEGPPVNTMTIQVAPQVSAAVTLRLVYVRTITALTPSDDNPIPGETDAAIVAWVVAYARAKEHPQRMPDANWLAIYGNEKKNTLTPATPRQEQEEEIVDDLFDAYN